MSAGTNPRSGRRTSGDHPANTTTDPRKRAGTGPASRRHLMTTEVVTSPPVRQHRSRTWFVAAAALVVGLGVGAAIVALTQTDSSTSSSSTAAPVTALNATTCTGDGGALFVVVSAMPTSDTGRVLAGVSSQTRELIRSGAVSSAATSTFPGSPDPATLAAVFSRIGVHDATTILSGLAPETRATIGSIPTTPQACR